MVGKFLLAVCILAIGGLAKEKDCEKVEREIDPTRNANGYNLYSNSAKYDLPGNEWGCIINKLPKNPAYKYERKPEYMLSIQCCPTSESANGNHEGCHWISSKQDVNVAEPKNFCANLPNKSKKNQTGLPFRSNAVARMLIVFMCCKEDDPIIAAGRIENCQ